MTCVTLGADKGGRMGRYWSVEECGWAEHTSPPEPEVVVEAPPQRLPDEETAPAAT